MTRQGPNSAHPQDPDADRLSAAWNDIVEGFSPSTDGADAELIATVRSLHAGAPDHRPQSEFRDNLREQLMDTSLPIDRPAFRQPPRIRMQTTEPRLRMPQFIGGRVVRWTAIAATIALLLTTGFGAWRGGLIPSNQGPHGTNIAAPSIGTPEALGTPEGRIDPCPDRYASMPCGFNPWIGQGLLEGASFSDDDLSVAHIQMQGWELEGGEQVTFAEPGDVVRGIGVDVVVSGAYSATFSAPVGITRPVPGNGGGPLEHSDGNVMVELSRGDVVTYPLGSKIEIRNRFQSQVLQFQAILFYEGDASAVNRDAAGRFDFQIDGDGTLAKALNEYPSRDLQVLVTFLGNDLAVPPDTEFRYRVLGPVATPVYSGEGGGRGFIVWLLVTKG